MQSFVSSILCVVLLTISGNVLAQGKDDPYLATDKEELYGTWINDDYHSIWGGEQKTIYYPDGRYEKFSSSEKETADFWGRYLITRKWSEHEGEIWYNFHAIGIYFSLGPKERFMLCKISDSGKRIESVYDFNEYPTAIDPESPHYRIYFRQ